MIVRDKYGFARYTEPAVTERRAWAVDASLTLDALRKKFPSIQRIHCSDEGLRKLLSEHRARWGAELDYNELASAMWFGVYRPSGIVAAAIGFQDEFDPKIGFYLFIPDYCGSRRALANLNRFVEQVPYTLRGAIRSENTNMTDMLFNRTRRDGHRKWRTIQALVESSPM